METQTLYQRQDEIVRIVRLPGVIEAPCLLVGGTALARAYLVLGRKPQFLKNSRSKILKF
ncbi:MAG: hypothetical protein Q8O31_06870 [Rhodocyclaceae bacterium]|nr:hypothetical protein [Rhodocyclaceae bacterium]